MKKLRILVALVAVAAFVFASCKSTHCPAYSYAKTQQKTEKPS